MLQNALVSSVAKLQQAKNDGQLSDFALIGGFAVSAWGYPRATADVDFALRIKREKIKDLALYLEAKFRLGDDRDPLVATVNFNIENNPIQLVVFPNNWDKVAFEEIQLSLTKDGEIPIVGWKQMVLLKLYAGSDADLFDAKRILEVQDPGKRGLETLRDRAKKLRVSKKFDRALQISR
jgi:hypothetical protein